MDTIKINLSGQALTLEIDPNLPPDVLLRIGDVECTRDGTIRALLPSPPPVRNPFKKGSRVWCVLVDNSKFEGTVTKVEGSIITVRHRGRQLSTVLHYSWAKPLATINKKEFRRP